MKKTKTQTLTLLAVLTALSLALAHLHIPTLTGFVTALDVGVYFTAFYLGDRAGAVVGGVSGLLIDLLLGYPQYAIFSLIGHGSQGYFAGWSGSKRILGVILSLLSMVGTYVLAALALGEGLGAALVTIPSNLAQSGFGLVVGFLLYRTFKQIRQD